MTNNILITTIEKILENSQLTKTFLGFENLEDVYLFLQKFDDSLTIEELQNLLNELSEIIHLNMHTMRLNHNELYEVAGGNNMGANIKKFTGTSLAALLLLGPVVNTSLLAATPNSVKTSSISQKDSSDAGQLNKVAKKVMNYLVGGTLVVGGVVTTISFIHGFNHDEQFTTKENQLIQRLSGKIKGHIKSLSEYDHKQFTSRENQWIQLLSGNAVLGNTEFEFKSYEEFRNASPKQLEDLHGFVQLFFPTRNRSNYANQDLYLDAKLQVWKDFFEAHPHTYRVIQENMYVNFIRMLQFWKFKIALDAADRLTSIQVNPSRRQVIADHGNHNNLRVTRVLNSLRLFGLHDVHRMLLDSLRAGYLEHPSLHAWEQTQHTEALV